MTDEEKVAELEQKIAKLRERAKTNPVLKYDVVELQHRLKMLRLHISRKE